MKVNEFLFYIKNYLKKSLDTPINVSWAQAAEDIAIHKLLQNDNVSKFYIDIGAHHPFRLSVTSRLYNSGWRGVDVDANDKFKKEFLKYRKRNLFLNYAIGRNSEYRFVIFKEPAISTINIDWENKFVDANNEIQEIKIIEGLSLRQLLEMEGIPERVDFINIDVEGADEEALLSIEFETLPKERFPTWLLLETHPPVSNALNSPAVSYAMKNNYLPYLVLPMNTLLRYSPDL